MSVGISTSEHGEAIDLMTVVKAAQAISGQIVLEQLIGRLMKIVLENAGAQRCVLLLERSGRLVVEAEQVAGQQPALCRLGVLAEAEPHLAQAIILYVERTRESVALRDAAAEGAFTQDPYIVESRARSILCAPLLNQGKRIALLYLENNLTIGAFTENRVEVLRLLSAQAVLSIQNAILFESLEDYSRTLEQKVEERTGELREKNAALADTLEQLRATQQQLVTQEKLASLGALTAGIAHELKNPLNFVTNFAELAGGLVDEVLESLDAGGALSRDVLSDVHESMDMLRSNVVKIGEHGRRANDIINGMLLHSRHVASPREPIEINTVIAQSLDYAVQGLRARDPSFGVRVHAEYDRTIGQIDAVAMDLHRVVINLINNAAYAIAQKRRGAARDYVPAIAVRTVDLGPRMEIRIRDNGTGISRDIVGSIWNPFFTTKPAGDGTGLGLSISYDIVTQGHQGEIRVESTPGESTEFIITLPKPPRSAA
jgi:signal transduction histidine kinase